MIPLGLFRSRVFSLANALTLFVYAALGVILFLVPMNLFRCRLLGHGGAGAALLPFPIIVFVLSRWSGGLVASVGSRLPLTLGPVVSAVGVALYARPGIGGSTGPRSFPRSSCSGSAWP